MISARKRIWGWYFFDWASQPYNTLLLTFIFGPYFAEVAREYYMGQGLEADAAMAGEAGRRPQCRPCLDWSERRMHLAGRLGASHWPWGTLTVNIVGGLLMGALTGWLAFRGGLHAESIRLFAADSARLDKLIVEMR